MKQDDPRFGPAHEADFREVVEDLTELISRFRADGVLTYVNDVYCRFFGKARTELVGSTWHPHVVAEDVPRIEELLRTLSPAQPVVLIENRVYSGRGEVRWMQFVNRAFFDEQGRLQGMQSVGRDITDHRQAEAARLESEERLQLVLGAVNDGVWDWDLRRGLAYLSPRYHEMTGYQPGEIVPDLAFLQCIVHPEDYPRLQQGMEANLRGETALSICEYRMITKGGAIRWVLGRGRVVERDALGAPLRMLGTITDITERKAAEKAREESERFARATLDALTAHIAVLDGTGRIVWVNRAWRDFAAANPPVLHNVNEGADYLAVCDAAPGADGGQAKAVAAGIRSVLDGRRGVFQFEYACHSPETKRWFACRVSRFPGPESGRVVVAHENITDRIRAEEALRLLTRQLGRAEDNERRRIARDLHDVTGQRLAAMSMTLGLLESVLGDAAQSRKLLEDCFSMIEECAQETRTLSYLLHPPLLDELGMAVAIRAYVNGYSARSGVSVEVDAPAQCARWPDEVELALFRVMQEALGNVHRHARSRTARIRLLCEAGQVTLEVIDQGRGLSGDAVRALEAGGSPVGVGFAAMQERLRILGGRLELESGPQGTTIRALVPRSPERA